MNQNHHPLYQELCGILGKDYVRDGKMSLITYAKDMSSNPAVMSGVVVRPKSTEEISEIVKLANRSNCPIILRGGGESANGVTKGVPNRNIVIDMGRMQNVTDIDIENQRVEFQGGIRPYLLDEALKPYGYFAHTVMGPYHTDSMAGLVSGVQGAGYPKDMSSAGLNWHHILGLKVVLPTGEIITTGAGHDSNFMRDRIYYREASSPDFTGLFLSGGGSLGIITEITMRIYKLPKVRDCFGYCFDQLDDAWNVMLELSSDTPTAYTNLYLSDTDAIKKFGTTVDANYAIFFAIDSDSEEDKNIRKAKIVAACEKNKGVLGDDKVTFFATHGMAGSCMICREASSDVCPFLSTESLYPRKGAKEILLGMDDIFNNEKELVKEVRASRVFYVMPIANYILMGFTLHWDETINGAGERMLPLWKKEAEWLNWNGSCSAYTQGNNSNVIAEMWTPAYHNLMKAIKTTLDPNNILCPGLWNL